MIPTGKLIGIARRAKPRIAMEELDRTTITRGHGLDGDFRGQAKDRNVTVLFREGWEAACRDLGRDLPWTTRRANLYVEGLSAPQEWGARLRIGPVLLMVTEECDPCSVMEKQAAGLRAALSPDWRGGVACIVLEGGVVALGDAVELAAA